MRRLFSGLGRGTFRLAHATDHLAHHTNEHVQQQPGRAIRACWYIPYHTQVGQSTYEKVSYGMVYVLVHPCTRDSLLSRDKPKTADVCRNKPRDFEHCEHVRFEWPCFWHGKILDLLEVLLSHVVSQNHDNFIQWT